jgi:hypothetical protein
MFCGRASSDAPECVRDQRRGRDFGIARLAADCVGARPSITPSLLRSFLVILRELDFNQRIDVGAASK